MGGFCNIFAKPWQYHPRSVNISPGKFRTLSLSEQQAGRTLSIQRSFALLAFFNGMVLVALVASSMLLLNAAQKLNQTHLLRYQSYLLADELRQNSDTLSRLARTYAVTGDPVWERRYWETLAIRDGGQPRPQGYAVLDWDSTVADPGFRVDTPATQVPWTRRMERLGFSPQEIAQFTQAEADMGELLKVEATALNAVKGVFADARGGLVRGKPDPALAQRLLYDTAYHAAKAGIMRSIGAAYDLLDARTRRQVRLDTQLQEQWLDLTLLLVILMGMSAIASYQIIRRYIVNPLTSLAEEAHRIADGHWDGRLTVYSGDEVGRLTAAFNAALDRMSEALKAADAANRGMAAAHKQIDDSIDYARLLQRTILPERQLLRVFAEDHCVLWQPRDRVGGDFYVFHGDDGRCLIGIGDCAGHGVPGAMMTMLARAGIDRAIYQTGIASPAAVLAKTDEVMRAMLADAHLTRTVATSMDVGLVHLDRTARTLRFAGAKIGLYWSDGAAVGEVAGERRALADRRPGTYRDHDLDWREDRTYYLTTDGFLDQAGGEHGFGFGGGRFAAMLREHARLPLAEQGAAFNEVLSRYRGELAQRDDITLLSFRLTV
ncbi:Serine phosphatase RsbU, regulator of sigma subunit [Methylomagnum ishizawai]|uniref:Serine phosphatase RsbU, regulator of sigma subunit n=1 Tax=Methylomagnum ishizawai TaxID=1760988 RepID=A0A1Y6CWZ2_9GAMM|nr:SpoIIE family protein phosphatase [Methylomagnum ishizawai]SMF94796.1 Serine phosphatase RsbU, regulator of sigma subunit [Methylomagnum ishizawai]